MTPDELRMVRERLEIALWLGMFCGLLLGSLGASAIWWLVS